MMTAMKDCFGAPHHVSCTVVTTRQHNSFDLQLIINCHNKRIRLFSLLILTLSIHTVFSGGLAYYCDLTSGVIDYL